MKEENLKERVARRVSRGALVLMGMTGFGAVALAAPAADIAAPVQDGVTKSGGASATTETQIAQRARCCAVTGVRG